MNRYNSNENSHIQQAAVATSHVFKAVFLLIQTKTTPLQHITRLVSKYETDTMNYCLKLVLSVKSGTVNICFDVGSNSSLFSAAAVISNIVPSI